MDGQDQASFNDIAPDFDRLFEDVNHLTELEGEALDTVFRRHTVKSVLDVACGTGIQSIGLARRGYQVAASDISPQMVRLTRQKAAAENLALEVRRADFRTLSPWRGRRFDALVSSGNSLTLLKNEADIERSLHSMLSCLKAPGGVGVVGIHDYALAQQRKQTLFVRQAQADEMGAELLLDVRQFGLQRTRVSYLFVYLRDGRWRMKSYAKSYLTLAPEDLASRMIKAGFREATLYDVSGQRPGTPEDEWVLAIGLT